VQAHPLLRSRCSETVAGGISRGEPTRCQYSTRTGADTDSAEHRSGDSATPLETEARQHTNAEKQRAADTKAASMAVLAEQDQERQQGLLRDAQELTRCLNSGMGLLTPEEVRQIANAVTGTNKEPMEVLRGLHEPATPNLRRPARVPCKH
jgi:hypothetical protein